MQFTHGEIFGSGRHKVKNWSLDARDLYVYLVWDFQASPYISSGIHSFLDGIGKEIGSASSSWLLAHVGLGRSIGHCPDFCSGLGCGPSFRVLPSCFPVSSYRLLGLVVKASASRAEDPGFESRLRQDFFFRGRVIPVTSKLALQWLPCQAPDVIGSVLELVGPVSVYYDWVRWKVWSATFISVWQHVKLSEQIRPWDTLTCWWDVKQPTNQQQPCLFNSASVSRLQPFLGLSPLSPSVWCFNSRVAEAAFAVCVRSSGVNLFPAVGVSQICSHGPCC